MTNPPTATEQLHALQDRLQELQIELGDISIRFHGTMRQEVMDTRNFIRGVEQSPDKGKMAACNEAKTHLARLQEQQGAAKSRIDTLKCEIDTVKASLAAITNGPDGYKMAVAIYREAKARVAKVKSEMTANQAQQEAAMQAHDKAQKDSATATRNLESALDADGVNLARAAFSEAQQALDNAETLVANLKRHKDRLDEEYGSAHAEIEQARKRVFDSKASLLMEEVREQVRGRVMKTALEAFTAARLAGYWVGGFQDWFAKVIDPGLELFTSGADCETALMAELEAATVSKT